MPLTVPAHQLVVLPLLRGRAFVLPGSALVVGTILPDLAFVIGGYRLNVWSHTPVGPPIMAVALGLFLYVWAERVLLPALTRCLPCEGRWPFARLCQPRGLPTRPAGWIWALVAITLGAYSHLLLDGFTHAWMWPANVLYRHTGFARFLQEAGSAGASALVFAWMVWRMRRLAAPDAPVAAHGLGVLIGGTIAGALLAALLAVLVLGWPEDPRRAVFVIFSPGLAGAFVGASLAARRVIRSSRR